ncbi:MAG: acyl-CoA thioesterase [Betaproteobacteria bacterium]|nr:acyl-CoA thioesterase [Betaproteobacteria bacterium]
MSDSHAQPFILLHECIIPVRWGDQDALGHVNNTVFFRFMEQARVEWFEQQGVICNSDQPQTIVIVHASCTFLKPITYPANVRVRLYGGEPGRSSVMTRYELLDEDSGNSYATGEAKVVWIDPVKGKSIALPDSLRALLRG